MEKTENLRPEPVIVNLSGRIGDGMSLKSLRTAEEVAKRYDRQLK